MQHSNLGRVKIGLLIAFGCSVVGSLESARADTEVPRYRADSYTTAMRLDQVYYVQPHNTWDHGSSLKGWLDRGFRTVELDVLDKGEWKSDVNGPYVGHNNEGDQNCSGSGNTRLGHCLQDVMDWIDQNDPDVPILVYVDLKYQHRSEVAWKANIDETPGDFQRLDEMIKTKLGTKYYTFENLKDFYPNNGRTVRENMRDYGWPTLTALRGKILVFVTGGQDDSSDKNREMGLALDQSGWDPHYFFCPDSSNNPDELNPGGTLVGMTTAQSQSMTCSNLESADHYQRTANRAAAYNQMIHLWGNHVYASTSFTYNYIAVAHGISAISQYLNDYSDITDHGQSIPLVGARRSLPGYFMVKPIANPNMCLEASPPHGNGSVIRSWPCDSNNGNQHWEYTAEGQLRPKHLNTHCLDIEGGIAETDRDIHLWDCDGGVSEKWYIDPEGYFKNISNPLAGWYCLDSDTGQGDDWETFSCVSGHDEQRFQLQAVPEPNRYKLHTADVSGDGKADLIWNFLDTENRTYVALANGDGTFTRALTAWDQPEGGWTGYTLHVADVSGDGEADLIWNSLDTENRTYVALSNGDGTFTRALTAWDQPEGGWTGYTLHVADVSGDGEADLIWNSLDTENRTYVALSNGDGTFTRALTAWDQPEGGWTGYTLHVADVSGDGEADLIWNSLDTENRTYVALSNGDGTFTRALTAWDQPEGGWTGYTLHVADVSGDGEADLIWNSLDTENRTYVALSNGDGTFTRALTAWDQPEGGWTGYTLHVADVSGDGEADLIWSYLGVTNRTYVALSNGDGTFTRALTAWDQPEGGWIGYTLHVADVSGDGEADLIWSHLGVTNRTYVALSNGDGTFTRALTAWDPQITVPG